MDSSQLYWVKSDQDYGPDHYVNEIFLKTNTIPTQCYFVNDNTALFIKFPQGTDMDKWHNSKNLKSLKSLGLTLKLSSMQLDKNSVFINSAPEAIFNQSTEALLDHINESNPNIQALSAYVPPKRGHIQKLGSVKLTLVTRNMVNSILSFGIRIAGCHIEPGSIRQAHYLKEQQCSYCYRFHQGRCQAEFPNCPNCSQHHSRHQCREKEILKCINCSMPHKATSNNCRIRGNMLTNELLNDLDLNTIICPFGKALKQAPSPPNPSDLSSTDWPPINKANIPTPSPSSTAWGTTAGKLPLANNMINPITPMVPLTTYHDVLKMSLMFDNWYAAFVAMLAIFGLPTVEFPPQLRAQFKGTVDHKGPSDTSDYYNTNLLNPSAHNNYTTPSLNKTSASPLDIQLGASKDIYLQHKAALLSSQPVPPQINPQEPFPLTGANTVPLPIKPTKDSKGTNKSTKGKGLLPTPTEPLLPTSLSMAPSFPKSTPQITQPNTDSTLNKKELQWGDDEKGWKTPTEGILNISEPILDMPLLEDTQINYTTLPKKGDKKERLSMDANLFRSTVENFENLSSSTNQPKHTTQLQNTQPKPTLKKYTKPNFNLGSNTKISPKPKTASRQQYKHSTPSPQKEGMCTSSESETDSDEEVNVDDVQEMAEDEVDDTLEDLTKTVSETIPKRRQLRSSSKNSSNL